MNKSLQVLLGTFSLTALLGAGCLGAGTGTPETTNTTSNTEPTTSSSTDSLFSGNFADALALGQKMTCSWSAEEGSGVAYIDGERFASVMNVDNKEGSMITTEDCMYTWEIGGTEGIKICNIEELADEINEVVPVGDDEVVISSTAQEIAEEFQDDVEVNCVAGIEDESVFIPPTDVTFIDPLAGLNFSL